MTPRTSVSSAQIGVTFAPRGGRSSPRSTAARRAAASGAFPFGWGMSSSTRNTSMRPPGPVRSKCRPSGANATTYPSRPPFLNAPSPAANPSRNASSPLAYADRTTANTGDGEPPPPPSNASSETSTTSSPFSSFTSTGGLPCTTHATTPAHRGCPATCTSLPFGNLTAATTLIPSTSPESHTRTTPSPCTVITSGPVLGCKNATAVISAAPPAGRAGGAAREWVSKSQTVRWPEVVPAAMRLPWRLKAKHVDLCASSRRSSIFSGTSGVSKGLRNLRFMGAGERRREWKGRDKDGGFRRFFGGAGCGREVQFNPM
mmetsp:Transcript_8736/g.21757  ORF Transcript_8736/g.21757 Transcript_8736/m.21757 type:complete len:316 (+) Transcript_8736:496-1443(+)